jgi:hypothetical protein
MHFVQQNVRNTAGGNNMITVSTMSALGLSTPECRGEQINRDSGGLSM